MEVKRVMPSNRPFHWHTAGVCIVPAAVLAASLAIGGAAHSAPPGKAEQIATEAADPTKPTITLSTNPVSPVTASTQVTLIAQLSESKAVGKVQFKEGTRLLGEGMVSGGTASSQPMTFTTGSHALTATFVPGSTAYLESTTVSPLTFEVKAAETKTTLTTSPAAEAAQGELVTLTATVTTVTPTTPTNVVGSVQFYDGNDLLGDPQPVNGNGVATGTTYNLRAGSHTLIAEFIPTNLQDFSRSRSDASSLTVRRSGAAAVVALDSQDALLSLDLGSSALDDHACGCDGRGTLDGWQGTADEGRTLVDGRVSVLDGRPLLNVVLDLG
jgi:hypothetical protein